VIDKIRKKSFWVIFPDKIFSLAIPMFTEVHDICLTSKKFPDTSEYSKFSRQSHPEQM